MSKFIYCNVANDHPFNLPHSFFYKEVESKKSLYLAL